MRLLTSAFSMLRLVGLSVSRRSRRGLKAVVAVLVVGTGLASGAPAEALTYVDLTDCTLPAPGGPLTVGCNIDINTGGVDIVVKSQNALNNGRVTVDGFGNGQVVSLAQLRVTPGASSFDAPVFQLGQNIAGLFQSGEAVMQTTDAADTPAAPWDDVNVPDGETRFLGISLGILGGEGKGWLRIRKNLNDTLTILDAAFIEGNATTSIAAGEGLPGVVLPVPEPGSLTLLATGAAAVLAWGRRKRDSD